eukprot:1758205-Prymnesium_polylepis.1
MQAIQEYSSVSLVCYGSTGHGKRTGHASGTRNRHGGTTVIPYRRAVTGHSPSSRVGTRPARPKTRRRRQGER